MLRPPPVRVLRRILPALFVGLLYGCSDAPTSLEPRIESASPRPHTLLAPDVVVTNTDDGGPGSLRQAIADAADGSVIHFDPAIAGQTIVLSSGQINVDKALTIEGPLPSGMTISGGFVSRVFNIDATGNAIIRNLSIVNGNTLTDAIQDGGAIRINGSLLLDHVLVANNIAARLGGGIYVRFIGQLTLVNSTVSGNVGDSGGGIESDGALTIWNSTITSNVSPQGGGIAAVANLYLRNSIVAGNIDTDDASVDPNCAIMGGVVLFSGTNLSNDGTCGTGAGMIVAPSVGLGPLADNGGPTKTHALLRGSPAIDAGTSCTEATDQRYVSRNNGTSCDIGAFEFTDYATVTMTIGPNVAVNAKTGTATVTGTIKCSVPTTVALTVALSQTQKTTGKFSTIVQASSSPTAIACPTANSASSWSVLLTPQSGKFEPGAATGTASAAVPNGFLAPTVTTPLKLFQVK